MSRIRLFAALTALFVALLASGAQAANPHFVTGFAPPECSLQGTSVVCTGTEIAGVGNNDAVATLSITASGVVDCNNPSESNQNNPIESHETTFTVTATSGKLEPKNGRLVVPELTATAPSSLTPQQEAALCPNPQWDAVLRDVTVTGFSYDITFVGEDTPFFQLP